MDDLTNFGLSTSECLLKLLSHCNISSALNTSVDTTREGQHWLVLVLNKLRRSSRLGIGENASTVSDSWLKCTSWEERKLSLFHLSGDDLLGNRKRLDKLKLACHQFHVRGEIKSNRATFVRCFEEWIAILDLEIIRDRRNHISGESLWLGKTELRVLLAEVEFRVE